MVSSNRASHTLSRLSILAASLGLFTLILFLGLTRYNLFRYDPEACLDKGQHQTSTYTEIISYDGMHRYERKILQSTPSLVIMILNHDETSWGKVESKQRTEEDVVDLILSMQLNMSDVSISIMTASQTVYHKLKAATSRLHAGRISILYYPETQTSYSYKDRKKPEYQHQRRANIAAMRNYLMLRTLEDEMHIIWFDADIIQVSSNLVQIMISHAEKDTKKVGIITARCENSMLYDLDWNAWYLDRDIKALFDAVSKDQREQYITKWIETRKLLGEQIKGLKEGQMAKLDSVGGTSLYVRADSIRKGVNFPVFNIVGTTWAQDGWVGQETEGICYMAKHLTDQTCWALGNQHYTRHA